MGGLVFKNEPNVNGIPTYEFAFLSLTENKKIDKFYSKPQKYVPNKNYVVAYTIHSNESYKVKSVITNEQLKKLLPTFIQWKCYIKPGDTLTKTIDYITYPAELELASKNNKAILKDCATLWDIEENNISTLFKKK